MKQFFKVGLAIIMLAEIFNPTVYSFSLPTIDGATNDLSSYNGKRVLVITLPVIRNAEADSLLGSIDSLAAVHSSTLKVVAVPAFEDGFIPDLRDSLKIWYRNFLDSNIVVTDGLHVRKTSGAVQHPLFNWLTNQTQNMHFNQDAAAPGYKYFTNTEGNLVAVLRPQTKLSSTSTTRALQAQ